MQLHNPHASPQCFLILTFILCLQFLVVHCISNTLTSVNQYLSNWSVCLPISLATASDIGRQTLLRKISVFVIAKEKFTCLPITTAFCQPQEAAMLWTQRLWIWQQLREAECGRWRRCHPHHKLMRYSTLAFYLLITSLLVLCCKLS